jgi:tetratricopeptide (TPR) repeat protein
VTARWLVLLPLLAFVSDRAPVAVVESALALSLLDIARDVGQVTPSDQTWSRGELLRLATAVGDAKQPDASQAQALNRVVFETMGFVREVDDADLEFALLPSVLKSRRGSCVGLGTLYLALGEMLGWHVEALMVPGHFFVRVQGTNVELLRRGERMPDAWYRERFPIPAGSAAEYARPLRAREVLGVVEYDIGNWRRHQGRLLEARREYEQAARDFPDFAEAHASLGLTLHLLGALDEADAAYRAARAANALLPGLDHNVELLEAERAAERMSRAGSPSPSPSLPLSHSP